MAAPRPQHGRMAARLAGAWLLIGWAWGPSPGAGAGEATLEELPAPAAAKRSKTVPLLLVPAKPAGRATRMPETTGAEASSRKSGESNASFAGRMDELLNAAQEQRRNRLELLQGQIRVLDRLLNPEPGHGDGTDSVPPALRPSTRPKTRPPQLGASSPRTTPEGPRKSPSVTSQGPPRPEAIDPLSLADNLFGADDVPAALKIYQGLTPAKFSPGHRQWIRYQIASCHRRLGDVGTAEQEYRELAGTKTDDRIAAQARWWLDAIQKRKRLESGLKAAGEALNSSSETTRKGE